jgi:hypothetical protein
MAHKQMINPELLLPLQKATKLLPNVKPRRAAATFVVICEMPYDAAFSVNGDGRLEFDDDAPPVDVGVGVLLSCNDVDDCIETDLSGTKRVSPKGAALMIRLYEAGLFERQRVQDGLGDPVELGAYAQSEADLRARTEARRADDERARAEHERLIANPDHVREDEFNYRLLDDIFWHYRGKGSHVMSIGGIAVCKEATTYSSDSGKSSDSAVVFSWTGAGGTRREIRKDSIYARNRRNDADRNWGLPE